MTDQSIAPRFVQLHLLTFYAPANLNRDDTGRPKTAMIGGAERLRVSSRSLKRAVRASDGFGAALEGYMATRSRRFGRERVLEALTGGEGPPRPEEDGIGGPVAVRPCSPRARRSRGPSSYRARADGAPRGQGGAPGARPRAAGDVGAARHDPADLAAVGGARPPGERAPGHAPGRSGPGLVPRRIPPAGMAGSQAMEGTRPDPPAVHDDPLLVHDARGRATERTLDAVPRVRG